MPRRFNYTGRQRIRREDAVIRLQQDSAGMRFDADLRLASYGFDAMEPKPKVYVEAYRGASAQWKRFDFGFVDTYRAPTDCTLEEFGVPEGILFRVKVTGRAGDADGRLLAAADAIRPRLPNEQDDHVQPLIQHVPADDIGDELWRVDFSDQLPLLKINSRVPGGVEQFLLDPTHRASITPAVMRIVLMRILLVERDRGDDEDAQDWRSLWLRFASGLCLGAPPEIDADLGEFDEWIDRAVETFAAKAGLLKILDAIVASEENQ
jgi:hypothetical protein